MIAALDFAESQNRAGRFAGKLAPRNAAAMGHSCGGLQAIAISTDPRVRTTVALNSGVLEQPRVKVDKSILARLHAPILYVVGGPGDMAYPNAVDDFARIGAVPAVLIDNGLGHGGELRARGGGPSGEVVSAWLDWRLKGVNRAADFSGPQCRFCNRAGWTLKSRGATP